MAQFQWLVTQTEVPLRLPCHFLYIWVASLFHFYFLQLISNVRALPSPAVNRHIVNSMCPFAMPFLSLLCTVQP